MRLPKHPHPEALRSNVSKDGPQHQNLSTPIWRWANLPRMKAQARDPYAHQERSYWTVFFRQFQWISFWAVVFAQTGCLEIGVVRRWLSRELAQMEHGLRALLINGVQYIRISPASAEARLKHRRPGTARFCVLSGSQIWFGKTEDWRFPFPSNNLVIPKPPKPLIPLKNGILCNRLKVPFFNGMNGWNCQRV